MKKENRSKLEEKKMEWMEKLRARNRKRKRNGNEGKNESQKQEKKKRCKGWKK